MYKGVEWGHFFGGFGQSLKNKLKRSFSRSSLISRSFASALSLSCAFSTEWCVVGWWWVVVGGGDGWVGGWVGGWVVVGGWWWVETGGESQSQVNSCLLLTCTYSSCRELNRGVILVTMGHCT